MPDQTHHYSVDVVWTGGRDGKGHVAAEASGTTVSLAVPKEFGGHGGASNPEELLTSAIASCYTITFGIIAANRKLPVSSVNVTAVGEVLEHGGALTFKKVTIRPTIVLDREATDEQKALAADMAHKADGYCLVTNAVRGKVEVIVEPSITTG